MHLRSILLALALAAVPVSASASRSTNIWNGTSGVLTVRDNGQLICETRPYGFCAWEMADGYHRVEVTFNGVTLSMEGTIPNDDFGGSFADCDFDGSECPEDEDW